MGCAEIKDLLSEYIEGTLDGQKRALVEGHLSACGACSEELASLKRLEVELAALKRVKAPEDFLERVHERIERRFEFERIMRMLFVPAKIKIPMELAGVLATAVLAVWLFRFLQPAEEPALQPPAATPTPLPAAAKPIMIAKRPAEKPLAEEGLVRPAAVTAARPVAEEDRLRPAPATASLTGEERPIMLALLVGPRAAPAEMAAMEGTARTEAATVAMARTPSAVDRMRPASVRTTSAHEAVLAAGEERVVPRKPLLNEVLERIRGLASGMGGRVTSVKYIYEGEVKKPHYVSVEIPAGREEAFLEQLSRIGNLKEPPPSQIAAGGETLKFTIELIAVER
jgi:hypothetical protein